jgi:SAM-dependent methyltransferase
MHSQPETHRDVLYGNKLPTVLLGLDNCGEVFTVNERVYRGIFQGFGEQTQRVHSRCRRAGLFDAGVVKTEICDDEGLKQLGYELVLEHERIPFISYAHEWSPQMLKDAALFQLDLNLRLIEHGLILKDCGSTANVLFDNAQPVQVDFLSIIPIEELVRQDWLVPLPLDLPRESGSLYEIFRRIFYPGMLHPLYLMAQGRIAQAQKRMLETFLNVAQESLSREEALSEAPARLRAHFTYFLGAKANALRRNDLIGFHRIQRLEIEHLAVELYHSGYSDYYELKGEDLPHTPSEKWKSKQRAVFEALNEYKPATVLDLGANTGWFSTLAAKSGANVIAADIDPACADIFYRKLRSGRLRILPLVFDLLNSTPDMGAHASLRSEPHFTKSHLPGRAPLLLSSQKRLNCDLVLALALIHHLCLGRGVHIAEAVSLLSGYSNDVLLLEFVEANDPLVVGEPEFFQARYRAPHQFDWYNLENLIGELKRHFLNIRKVSLTETRILLVCDRRHGSVEIDERKDDSIEHITWKGQHIASIIRSGFLPSKTVFISPESYYQQLGFVVYPKDGVVSRHSHLPLQRHLVGTPETLLVRKGKAEVHLFAIDKSQVGTWVLEQGDIIQLVSGGHRFKCLQDTVFLEIKQGPYTGLVEKEPF